MAKIPTYYSSASAYSRIETGEHRAPRAYALAIVTTGLNVTDAAEINDFLSTGEYAPLSADEAERLFQSPIVRTQPASERSSPAKEGWFCASLLIAAAVLAGCFSRYTVYGTWAGLLICGLYAAQYGVSILLETEYGSARPGRMRVASVISALVLLSSVAGLIMDRYLARSARPYGLVATLALFFAVALGQWLYGRRLLPNRPIVPTTYTSHTAQGAHTKNTLYFLFLAVFFWLPEAHAISSLRSHPAALWPSLWRPLLVGKGYLSLGVSILVVMVILLIYIAPPASFYLLDNVKPDEIGQIGRRNRYVNWFYARVVLFFAVAIFSVSWFATNLSV